MTDRKVDGQRARKRRSLFSLRSENAGSQQNGAPAAGSRLGRIGRRAETFIRRAFSSNNLRTAQNNGYQNLTDQNANTPGNLTPSASTTLLGTPANNTPVDDSSLADETEGNGPNIGAGTDQAPGTSTIRLVNASVDMGRAANGTLPAYQRGEEIIAEAAITNPLLAPDNPPRVLVSPPARTTPEDPLSLEGFEWSPPPSSPSSPSVVGLSSPPRLVISPPEEFDLSLEDFDYSPPPSTPSSLSSTSFSAAVSSNPPTVDVPDLFVPPAERMTADFNEETADVDQRASRAILQRPRSLQNILQRQREQDE